MTEHNKMIHEDAARRHIGETHKAKCGLVMGITQWRSREDITVRFEDGTERKTTYRSFQRGDVGRRDLLHISPGAYAGQSVLLC